MYNKTLYIVIKFRIHTTQQHITSNFRHASAQISEFRAQLTHRAPVARCNRPRRSASVDDQFNRLTMFHRYRPAESPHPRRRCSRRVQLESHSLGTASPRRSGMSAVPSDSSVDRRGERSPRDEDRSACTLAAFSRRVYKCHPIYSGRSSNLS